MKSKSLILLAVALFASFALIGCNAGESNMDELKAQNKKIDEAASKEPNRGGSTGM